MKAFIYTYYVIELNDVHRSKQCGVHVRWSNQILPLSHLLLDPEGRIGALLLWDKELSRAQVVDLIGEEATDKLEQDFIDAEESRLDHN